jgi:hypothetical protein
MTGARNISVVSVGGSHGRMFLVWMERNQNPDSNDNFIVVDNALVDHLARITSLELSRQVMYGPTNNPDDNIESLRADLAAESINDFIDGDKSCEPDDGLDG